MKRLRLLALAVLAPPAAAQGTPDLLWCDLTQDQLARFTDLDGDGVYASAFEASSFFPDPGSSPRDVQVRAEGGVGVAYWVDTVRDAVFRGADLDGDGSLAPAEVTEFRASHALDGSSSPDGLELTDDGAVWWSSDGGGHRGLFRLSDANGDGDANDPGEETVLVDGDGVHFAEVGGGPPVALDGGAIGRLAAAGDGVVAAVHGADEALYRFEDLDGDGDVSGPGESILFLNASGANPALPQNPDFADGTLPSLETGVTGPAGETLYGRLSYVTSYQGPEGLEVVVACDSTEIQAVAINVDGEPIHGLLFRAVDTNGDGDANDAGEVTLFYDGSTAAPEPAVWIDGVIGLDAAGDSVFVADVASGLKRVHRLRDADGDGAVEPATELEEAVFDLFTWEGEPFASGHAYVVELAAFPSGLFAPPTVKVTGSGCSAFGPVPFVGSDGVAALGASDFAARLWGAPAGAPAWLMVGSGDELWIGLPLPLDLGLYGFPGCTLYLDPFETFPAAADAAGDATVPLPIPAAPVLVGFAVEQQWLVLEPGTGAVALTALAGAPIVGG